MHKAETVWRLHPSSVVGAASRQRWPLRGTETQRWRGEGGGGPVVSHHPSMRRCEFYYCFPDCMDGGGGGGGNGRAVIHTGWQALDITLNRH